MGTESGQHAPGIDPSATIRRLARASSVEVTPREITRRPGALRDALPAGTRVYITFLPNASFDDTVAAAERAVSEGMVPVPHLAARAVPDMATLDSMAGRLGDLGVTHALVIGGSAGRQAGEIGESVQVLRSGVLQAHGITTVGVAGHPEGNMDIGEHLLARALREKNELAAESGMNLYLVTQFCFAAEPIVAWERRIRESGNRLPVWVGLPGLSSPAALVKYGLSCGVGPSLKVLRKQSGGMLKLATTSAYHPDETLVGLARSADSDPGSLIEGIHFFPFGTLDATAAWAGRLRTGAFRIDDNHLQAA